MRHQRLLGLMLLGTVWAIALPPVAAKDEIPSKTLTQWIVTTRKSQNSDIAQNVPIQVTGVSVFETDTALEIVLETAGQLSQPTTSVVGNTLIADIPNAVLNLPEPQEPQFVNPTAEIASLSVTNLPNNQIRVAIEGVNAPPTAQVSASAQELILTVTPSTNAAITDDEEAIQIVVTATRTEEAVENVPRSVTVVEREQIEQQVTVSQSRNLQDILGNLVPGLAPTTQSNNNTNQTLRGRQVQVLIDGVPLRSNLTNQPRDFRSIDPDSIERVEVVRGPSATYGDGGTGGVINIITRRPPEGEILSTVEVGVNAAAGGGNSFLLGDSFGNFFKYGLAGDEGVVDFVFDFSRSYTGGFFDARGDRIPQFAQDSDADTLSVLGKIGFDFSEDQRLQFSASYFEANENFRIISDPSIEDIPGIQYARALEVPGIEVIGGNEAGNHTTVFNVNYTHANLLGSRVQAQAFYRNGPVSFTPEDLRPFDFVDPGIFQSTIERELFGGRLQVETPVSSTLSVLWGADYLDEDISQVITFFDPEVYDATNRRVFQAIGTRSYMPPHNFSNLGLFAQAQWNLTDALRLSGGIRYERFALSVDDYTTVGFGLTPDRAIAGGDVSFDDILFNIGATYNLTENLSVFASFAQGFSAPTFGTILRDPPEDFTSVTDDFDVISPQLVNSYEIGVRGNWANIQASLAGFYNESELGIGFEESPLGTRIARQPQRFIGLEGTVDWQPINNLALGGSVTLLRGEFENEDGDYLAIDGFTVFPPKLTAYVQHETDFGWRNRLQLLYVGDRSAAFDDGVDPVPVTGYTTLDLISSIPLLGGRLSFSVENLLNRQYAPFLNQVNGGYFEPGNVAARGRTISVNYSIDW
ncbi:TonB-dependent receptor [Gloeocapsopsis crepidinum LEGE 06123]|uniref:TonB-dependent receptor n=1 Tax=Gloeocapsopsis crepidinum LEGE 06123 TaxID=588587 RepID=A0ABR9UKP1_9CHRO|nr:TonB-dependent receptor [Gloeocapsopsis crepidinum]MBE9188846.1 TonB-dependent receptor [Gloeocapsopsis crepidinum LEGE 06123]